MNPLLNNIFSLQNVASLDSSRRNLTRSLLKWICPRNVQNTDNWTNDDFVSTCFENIKFVIQKGQTVILVIPSNVEVVQYRKYMNETTSTEHLLSDNKGESRSTQRNPTHCHPILHKFHYGLAWDRSRASAVEERKLFAWGTTWPCFWNEKSMVKLICIQLKYIEHISTR